MSFLKNDNLVTIIMLIIFLILLFLSLCVFLLVMNYKQYNKMPNGCKQKGNCLIWCTVLSSPITIYPGMLPTSIMLFDAPGSEDMLLSWVLFFTFTTYPAFLLLADLLVIYLFRRSFEKEQQNMTTSI